MGIIRERKEKIKSWAAKTRPITEDQNVYLVLLLIVVAFLSYGLGRLSKIEEARIPVEIQNIEAVNELSTGVNEAALTASANEADQALPQSQYVGSVNSDKYHLPWCSGAKRIAEANQVWFASKEEAEAQGYQPAGNCPGI